MNQFYLIVNPGKAGADRVAEDIRSYLESQGAVCERNLPVYQTKRDGYKYTDARQIPKGTECVITLGGDGTLIQAARDLAARQIPMIGVNLGTLGYLTQISKVEEIIPMLDNLMTGNYQLEKRMMLDGAVMHGDTVLDQDMALNEIVITRKDTLRVLKFRVYVNGIYLNQYTADGVIVSTPTGSTAYNLSAGGPIAAPGAELMMLTPICAHTLNSRTVVLSPEDCISIEVIGDPEQDQVAVFDGDKAVGLAVGDRIEVRKSAQNTVLVKLRDVSFLDNLRNKLARV